MATVNKNFVVKNGLVIQGSTATVNGKDILTKDVADSYILNLVGGATLVKSVDNAVFTVDGSGNLTINSGVFDVYGAASTAQSNAESYADTAISNAISTFGSQTSTDIQDAITTAESYTDSAISQEITDRNSAISSAISTEVTNRNNAISTSLTTAENYADSLASNYDPAGSATSAENAAKSYADGLISTEVTNRNNAISTAKSEAISAAETYADSAVANVVGLAPAALDTLQELAAAFNNQPDTLTNLITEVGTKQATLTAGEGIYIDGSNVITGRQQSGGGLKFVFNEAAIDRSVVDGWYDASGSAATAESNANSYTDNAVGNIAGAVSQISGQAIAPESVTINSVAKQYASTISGIMIADGASTVMGISTSEYRTVKALVKAKNGTHTQVSELLITLDTMNNVAITEYAIVTTNGSLGDASAIYHASGNIFITFTPTYDNTDVMGYVTALI